LVWSYHCFRGDRSGEKQELGKQKAEKRTTDHGTKAEKLKPGMVAAIA